MTLKIYPILILVCLLPSFCTCLKIQHKQQQLEQVSHLQFLSHLAYKDNLQAQNWYYGSISATDYRVRIFQAANTQSITTCPISKPYITSDMNNCQSCPINAPLRNLGTYTCQACPNGYQYSTNIGNCSLIVNNTSSNVNTGINTNTNIVNNNVTTVTTTTNTTVNSGPAPTVVTPVSPTTSTTTTASTNNTLPNNITFDSSNADNVFFTNNTTNNNTATTTTPTTLIPTTTVTTTTNNTNTNNSIIGIIYNCSKSTPLYNPITHNCTSCPNNTQYINITNQCLPLLYITNLDKAIHLIDPSYNYTYNQNIHIINQHPTRTIHTCPINTPYLSVKNINGTTNQYGVCVACNSSLYFAVATQNCIVGCPKGTIHNSTQKLCVIGEYFTNPSASNLIAPTGSFSTWQTQNQYSKNNTINGQYCPIATPYQINGQCVACNGNDGSLFDVENKVCRNCGNGRNYNNDKKICQSNYNQGLSISRMIANIL